MPYGICCPWVRGGWDLDALGKFFRRRRRPRLLIFEQFLKQVLFCDFIWKNTFLRTCMKTCYDVSHFLMNMTS